MRVVRVHEHGGPEVMKLDELPTPEPGSGQVRVKVASAGVNYVDILRRSGAVKPQTAASDGAVTPKLTALTALPISMGLEGAGTIDAVGPDVGDLRVGDRVAWPVVPGSYATHTIVPVGQLVVLPDKLDFDTAAAGLHQAMTAYFLAHQTFPLGPSHTCLIHAAAGGVGMLLCQMAKMRGARVIGTVSSAAKAKFAKELGCDETILYTEQDFAVEVKRITSGAGVDVVYDSVGRDTFEKSLASLRRRGMMVMYGSTSGLVPAFVPKTLDYKGALFMTWASMAHYTATREEFVGCARDPMVWMVDGRLKVHIDRTLPLAQAAEAHRALADRGTIGKILLAP